MAMCPHQRPQMKNTTSSSYTTAIRIPLKIVPGMCGLLIDMLAKLCAFLPTLLVSSFLAVFSSTFEKWLFRQFCRVRRDIAKK